jgi:regulatory protein
VAVRFLPPPEQRPAGGSPSRADLAEVIELRSRLGGPGWGETPSEPQSESPRERGHEYREPERPESGPEQSEVPGVSGPSRVSSDGDPRTTEAEPSAVAEIRARLQSIVSMDAFRDGGTASAPGADAACVADAEPGAEATAAADDEDDRSSAYDDGVRLLARRARSSGELREELQRLEHPAHEVETVIAEFEQSHYLDDEGLARAVTEKLRETKRASRAQIRIKLRERRLPDSAIEEALGQLDTDEEFALLRETAQDRARKLGGLDRQTAERRLLGFLARRGWSGEPAMRAAREALDGGAGGGSGVRFR